MRGNAPAALGLTRIPSAQPPCLTPGEDWCPPRFVSGRPPLASVDSSPAAPATSTGQGTNGPTESTAVGNKQKGAVSATIIIAGVAIFVTGTVAGIMFIVSVGIQREEQVFRKTGRVSLTRLAPNRG